jgi:hypothetical protein
MNLQKKYHKQMPEALVALVLEHLPELLEEKEKFEKIIFPIAQNYTDEIWEDFNVADGIQHSKKGVKIYKVPKPKTKAEEEQKLLSELQKLPKECHDDYREVFWETREQINANESFVLAVHQKMKEVFAAIYLDDVLSLDSDYLRYFDRSLYFLANQFVQEIYTACKVSG